MPSKGRGERKQPGKRVRVAGSRKGPQISRNSGSLSSSSGGGSGGRMGRDVVPRRITSSEIMTREIPGFSVPRYRTKLTYSDDFGLSTGAGSCGTYVFSANGCYDPNITGTGHQPMGFDQMMLSFEHYTVLGATIALTIRSTDTDDGQWASISLNAGTTAVTDHNVLCENGEIVREKLGFSTLPNSIKTLVHKVDIRKFESVPSVLSDPYLQGTIAANPVEQVYFHISTWNAENANVAGSTSSVFIEYDVMFTEPRKNSASLQAKISQWLRDEALGKTSTLSAECKAPHRR